MPVLTDPQIQQPGSIAFDGNGRMYVLELRTYMLDADSKDELAPRSRISRWEDKNNDGVYETGTVFVDGLIFPRFVTPLGDGVILTKESNAGEVWMYTDTNKDGVADKTRAVHHRLRPVRQRGASGSRADVADGQLDVRHAQRRAPALDAERRASASRSATRAARGASPRTTTARCSRRAARAACRATSSSRSTTARSSTRRSSSRACACRTAPR